MSVIRVRGWTIATRLNGDDASVKGSMTYLQVLQISIKFLLQMAPDQWRKSEAEPGGTHCFLFFVSVRRAAS